MTYLFLVSLLTGAVFGMRLKVFVLIPSIGFALFAIAAFGMTANLPLSSIATSMVLAILGLQFGYLSGSTVRFFIGAARVASRRRTVRLHNNRPASA